MVDFKNEMGTRFIAAFAVAIMVYSLISPVLNIYALVASLGFFNCASSADWGCSITLSLMVFVLPVLAMFMCVWAIFEVFWK